MADVEDVRAPSPLDRLAARFGPPREYRLTRWLILRLLGLVYAFAFLGLILQGPGLLGSDGLTPIASYLDRLRDGGQTFCDRRHARRGPRHRDVARIRAAVQARRPSIAGRASSARTIAGSTG